MGRRPLPAPAPAAGNAGAAGGRRGVMAVLTKPAHEQFAQLVVSGKPASQAYIQVYGEAKGADQSASRLLRNAKVAARISELSALVSSELLNATIRDRNFRLDQLQKRHELLMRVVAERAQVLGGLNINGFPLALPTGAEGGSAARAPAENDDGSSSTPAPGASTGLVCLDWRGKNAERAVWKVDTGLLSELRAIELQAARELGQLNLQDGDTGTAINVPVQVNVIFGTPSN